MDKARIVFFGTPEFSVKILEAMKNACFLPALIITAPDKPKGRGMKMAPSPAKAWAEKNCINHIEPSSLKKDPEIAIKLSEMNPDLFVVASYGKILPKEILDVPRKGTLNVHPSLLPKLRGASPIQGAILSGEKETGVTIMLMDEKMDEGPILAKQKLEFPIANLRFSELEQELAEFGGKILTETIPKWLNDKITPQPQDHSQATYTKLIKKEDGEINWSEPAEAIFRKIRAYTPWPGAYTFYNGKRIIIADAEIKNDSLDIKRVKPEGKNEISFKEFYKNNPEFPNCRKSE
ncbi:MAG: methionyl-tRNA formyltransferase [Candidatus Pacebacteria bacterium]|nr:methionyl-tRNA formyltransferase [Candidatus Paceibacterota bacterium]